MRSHLDSKNLKTYQQVYEWAKNGEIPGGEFDWFASDGEGCVAAFCTGGFGRVPQEVFASSQADYLSLLTFLEDLLPNLPVCSGGFEPWKVRGVFAYDFQALGDYHRVAEPSKPLRISELPQRLSSSPALLRFPASFSAAQLIDTCMYWK
jgi:hypothetical protein